MYCGLGPKLGLVVRQCLASLSMESQEARWSSNSKSISEVKIYSDWNYKAFFSPFGNAGSWWIRIGSYWYDDASKEHLSFLFVSVLLWSGIYSGSCTGTQVTNVSPAVLAWEAFWKVTLVAPQVASEASKVLMVKSWTSVKDAIRSTPGASPPCLRGRTGRDECDTCVGKGQTKSDQEGKAFGVRSVYTPI